MATGLSTVTVNRGQGGLGRRALSQDGISGIVLYNNSPPAGFATVSNQKVFSIEEAETLGIIEGGTFAVDWYHINEFFRANQDGQLWIAKFPSTSDIHNVGAWELVVHDMAKDLGISVPEARVEQFGSNHHTFLIKRFDREGQDRVHYASAMTMLGQVNFSEDASYVDLVEWIIANSASPNEDLCELFKRMVLNVCVSNVDDHLRNHGFILTNSGWRLSPAFDMNPTPEGRGLRLNIMGSDNSLDLAICLKISKQFRLANDQATDIIEQSKKVTRTFEERSRNLGISAGDIQLVAQAFKNYTG